MAIYIHFEDVKQHKIQNKIIEKKILIVINNENFLCGELNIIFCSDKYLLEMNKKHLSHDYLTDIITFDYTEDNIISGDLFISIERVQENAMQFNVDYNNELKRVVIHGILHLVGYSDHTDSEKKIMREKEDEYL